MTCLDLPPSRGFVFFYFFILMMCCFFAFPQLNITGLCPYVCQNLHICIGESILLVRSLSIYQKDSLCCEKYYICPKD